MDSKERWQGITDWRKRISGLQSRMTKENWIILLCIGLILMIAAMPSGRVVDSWKHMLGGTTDERTDGKTDGRADGKIEGLADGVPEEKTEWISASERDQLSFGNEIGSGIYGDGYLENLYGDADDSREIGNSKGAGGDNSREDRGGGAESGNSVKAGIAGAGRIGSGDTGAGNTKTGGIEPGSTKTGGIEPGGTGTGSIGAAAGAETGALPGKSQTLPSDSYEAVLEKRVKEVLAKVEGVGEVDVLIVLKSSEQKVYQTDGRTSQSTTREQDSSGGTRDVTELEEESSTVLTSLTGAGAGSSSGPLLEKELRPEISGIVISAQGGGIPGVKSEITDAMEALFDLPAHKIKVLKRVE